MAKRSRLLTAILAVLVIVVSVAVSGCTQNGLTRTKDGKYEYTEGNDVWTWDQKGATAQITLNNKLFAVIQNGVAEVSLQDGRSAEVVIDSNKAPQSIKVAWGVLLTQKDYTQMNSAFSVNKSAGGQGPTGSLGGVIFLLILIVAGLLLFFYAGTLVDSWKLGGIFSGKDTAKSLLIVKAIGIFVVVVAAIILLAIIF
jgi:hypothetical protein